MSETPNRYGAHSNEQERWVLNGELHSGNPASQRETATSASSQSESSVGQMSTSNAAIGENSAPSGTLNSSLPDFGGGNSQSPSFPESPRKFPVPPGYEGNESWNAPSGMPRAGGSGAGQFFGSWR